MTARPDGTLLDAEGNAYSYLFWEGVTDAEYDFSKGFCVAGEDTADFLRKTLAEIGLTPENTTNSSCTGCRRCRIMRTI